MRKNRKQIMPGPDDRKVTVIRDTTLEFPELWLEVYTEGDRSERAAFAEMFARAKCTRAESPTTADLVVFTGGEDVNPIYYNEDRHKSTRCNQSRDLADIALYEQCLSEGIPMFGVCRGAQFLHVMNGGKLFQDVDGHYGDHPIFDVKKKRLIQTVSSVHHQMCIPNREGGMELIADSFKATERWKSLTEKLIGSMSDVEAFFYRDTCCFGVQGHPEYRGYHQYLQWTLQQIQELIVENTDLELRDRVRRMKREVMDERDARYSEKLKELN